jgi:hypothetical protein
MYGFVEKVLEGDIGGRHICIISTITHGLIYCILQSDQTVPKVGENVRFDLQSLAANLEVIPPSNVEVHRA